MKSEHSRRDFLAKSTLAGMAAMTIPFASCADEKSKVTEKAIESKLIIPKENALRITGTFLDEISHDIPHQNWGEKEWDTEFIYMKAVGIDTVIMIRSGYRKLITWPSEYLLKKGCYMPSVDLLEMFLRLAGKYGMKCWTNAETFDRDMPIRFFPIKFDKLRLKLEAAKRAGYDKAITFEFSHFMSPQSAYLQAGHLYNRYKEYFNI